MSDFIGKHSKKIIVILLFAVSYLGFVNYNFGKIEIPKLKEDITDLQMKNSALSMQNDMLTTEKNKLLADKKEMEDRLNDMSAITTDSTVTDFLTSTDIDETDTADDIEKSTDETGDFVCNPRSGIFHRANCSSAIRMKEKNKVYVNSVHEAEAKGCRPCMKCM